MRTHVIFWSFLTIAALGFSQDSEDGLQRFREAERQIVRLPPAAFRELPGAVVRELERRVCTIPQTVPERRLNVVRGEFSKPLQADWAVLCSVAGTSSILIFWNGSANNPAEVAPVKDIDMLQSDGGDRIVYSRDISAVGRTYILEHYQAYGGPAPPPINQQGINDAFVGKASVVHYLFEGKWLRLQGAD